MIACGLDFGTSNSAIGVARDKTAALVPVEADSTLMPSAVFFDYETKGRMLFGDEAISAYVEQTEGRLMRALKSILGSPLIEEETLLGGRKVPLKQVVEIFVRHLKHKAEAFAGQEITTVVHGRPVRFVDDDDAADARAQTVLEGIAKQVGFRDVAFVYEPIAAAHHYEQTVQGEELALIADIGGGTSDFSIIRVGPQHRERTDRARDVLATAGIRVGGTDFDTALNLAAVMPLLGLGTQLVKKSLPMPNALYHELAAWPTINFAYTYRNERQLAELVSLAREPEKVERLLTVVRERLGHRVAFAVEDAKIALSAEERAAVSLAFLEAGLSVTATRAEFDGAIETRTERLYRSASECIAAAGVKPAAIDTIFLTGGSSRVPAVRAAIGRAAPSARLASGSDLLSVASGLTQMAGIF
ncbi:Hsp70 family protein [Reyranella sp.]|uniref:Hsp70 family protein n=1 Tax=Reyranella sp. TaxID=1929291 RepID=UPI001206581F|nr:Hsp70 family protein [Reyranella sp.]TAJ82733.1 MAG: Hsp70 family protein [Reyranella sp.]